jgi:hypothetical protein
MSARSNHPLLAGLTDHDQHAIHQALRASVDGPFFTFIWAVPSGDEEQDRRWLATSPHHRLTTAARVQARGSVDRGEIHTLFGLRSEELLRITDAWPTFDQVLSDDLDLAINNALNGLTAYPQRCERLWSDHLPIDRDELRAVFRRWRAICPRPAR